MAHWQNVTFSALPNRANSRPMAAQPSPEKTVTARGTTMKQIAFAFLLSSALCAGPAQAQMVCPDPFSARGACAPVTGNAAGTTGAVVGTLAAVGGKTNYLCDFDVSAIGGTAQVGPITVAGLTGGSKVYQLSSSATGAYLSKSFNPCLPASASNTAITITTTAAAGATAVDVNSSGYQY
jgi:hypothetical protein